MADILPRQPVSVIVPPVAPNIESDRLLLRPVTDSDIPALFAVRSRPEVARFNHPKTPFKTHAETREWVSSKTFTSGTSDTIGRSFNYAICDKSQPGVPLIGYLSINVVVPCPEIGYSLLPETWGKGYATEALRLMLSVWWGLPRRTWGDEEEEERLYAISQRGNLGSCAVLRKCGFVVDREVDFEGDELYVWSVRRP
ncbi:N-acetyltransferase GNAT family [Penicillium atrosanguineum]|uniref:N-acetyltransferase GNAT family n=1 Tax=Penicillium atrosanguineum TaxID=1132637 RepID=A0A9W9Q3I9_9EURO|nr:N-acetyltransferase GNAT family [Penicillium atrosanguineum]KAJ5323744.1 N-acetyltransferase GNAT family [Penicillium atrosanguineum]